VILQMIQFDLDEVVGEILSSALGLRKLMLVVRLRAKFVGCLSCWELRKNRK